MTVERATLSRNEAPRKILRQEQGEKLEGCGLKTSRVQLLPGSSADRVATNLCCEKTMLFIESGVWMGQPDDDPDSNKCRVPVERFSRSMTAACFNPVSGVQPSSLPLCISLGTSESLVVL